MATSGTVTFRTNRNEIIYGSLRLCHAIDPEDTANVSANQITNAAQALNLMVKGWEANGLQLWERKYGAIFLQKGQPTYVLGSPGPAGDHACVSVPLGTGFVRTTLTSSISAGGTTAVVDSIDTAPPSTYTAPTTGLPYASVGVPVITIANGWYIGIEQADGTTFWTTVNGSPSLAGITLTTGPSQACSSGAIVTAYQTKMVRPLRILDGFVKQTTGEDIPCLLIPRENYNRFGTKLSTGTSIQLYYDPQSNSGHLYVYPTTVDSGQILFIEYQSPIQDFSSSVDDYDLPQEWGEALKYGLARRIAPEYSVPKDAMKEIKELAKETFDLIDSWDQENTSLFLQPSNWSYMSDGSSNK